MAALLQFRVLVFANIILLFCLLLYSVKRDIQLEKLYCSDLRNRVVGARLQKDGIAPYFYKWKEQDGMRYFDGLNKNSLHLSNITASPAFHDLLMPVSDLPQRTISLIWFWLQYLMLALMIFLFIRLGKNNFQRISILNLAVLFTYTEAWKAHITAGQIYFFIAFLFTLIIYFLIKSPIKKTYVVPAAFSTALLILCKPVALILFLPFAVRFKSFFSYIAICTSFVFLYALFAFFNKNECRYWVDYYYSLGEQVKVHQHQILPSADYKPLPQLTRLEGYDLVEIRKMEPVIIKSENGNIFALIQFFLHKTIAVKYLAGLFLITAILLMAGFIKKHIHTEVNLQQTILLAFLLYLLLEFFSPIYRHQYYTVQFLPLIFTAILSLKKWTEPVSILILTGLVLNISNTLLIPMRHTLGEFCWILAIVFIIFKKSGLTIQYENSNNNGSRPCRFNCSIRITNKN